MLQGKFFHTFKGDTNIVQYQGYIEAVVDPDAGYLIVQLYEWISGRPSDKKLMHIGDFLGANLYRDAEEMNEYYKYHASRQELIEEKE
jgi:hypothetical protein